MNKRNYGIDLLRITSMLMVLLLHILGAGGVLGATEKLSLNYECGWLLETAAYCAVNCYGLISGYVGWKSKPKFASIATLWLQVLLYSAGITVAFRLFIDPTIDSLEILKSFFPVINNYGWYFTCYFALFFLMPALNHTIQTLEERDLKSLCLSILIIFSILPTAAMQDIFQIKDGYSVIWLSALYIIGGCFGRFQWFASMKKRYLALIYAGCVFLSWGVKFLLEHFNSSWLSQFTYSEVLIRYKSPTILIAACALLLLFRQIRLPKIAESIVKFLSPAAFGVYIIHMHPQIWSRVIVGKFSTIANDNSLLLMIKVTVFAFLFYVAFSLLDLIRHYLFRWLNVKNKLSALEQRIQNRGTKINEK